MEEKYLKINQERVGPTVKLTFGRHGLNEITIDNLVDISFKYRVLQQDVTQLNILTRKNSKQKFTVKIKVFSRDNNFKAPFSDEWVCSDSWSEHVVGTVSEKLLTHYWARCALELHVVASKMIMMGPTFYEDENSTDFRLSASDGSVDVHKASLAAHSDMFKTMLNGEWKKTEASRMELPEASLQDLQALKDFLYLGTLPNEGLQTLLQIAIRFSFENLKTECIIKLAQNVKAEDFLQNLDFARDNRIVDLTTALLLHTPKNVMESACKLMIKGSVPEGRPTEPY